MTTINLKEFYPWYTHDEYIEVSDEAAEELKTDKRYEAAYRRRVTRNKAQYSLDCDDGIEYSACVFEPSPEELVLRKERLEMLCRALNSLSEKQGRRVEARVLDGKKLKEVAEAEGVSLDSISDSVLRGIANMRTYLKENW
jgi:RNA polymerase sigma factor (sigma-70 family)